MDTNTTQVTNVQPAGAPRLGGAGALALLLGFLAGLLLYLPWETLWDLALKRLAANQGDMRISWQSIDRAAPLNFRINGLVVNAPGWPLSPRLQWLEVRLGMSPRLTLRADTGGRELRLVYLDSGEFSLDGTANLACLGRRDILGLMDVRAEGRLLRDKDELEKGFLDLRGKALQLPGGLWLGEAALSLEFKERALRIRSFTLREPVQMRAEGTANLRSEAFLLSPYAVSGEILRDRESLPFTTRGVLGDLLGNMALSE